MSATMERLTSGQRVNRAADDGAALSISERLRSQSAGALRAQRNVQDGISVVQTVDGVLAEVQAVLQRTRELAVRYQHGTLSAADKLAAQGEADALGDEVARLTASAQFNGWAVLSGGTLTVHVGGDDEDGIAATLPDLNELVAAEIFSLDGSGTTTTTTTTTTTGGGSGGSNAGGNGNGNGNANGNGNGGGPTKNGGGVGKVVTETITFTSPAGPPLARLDAAIGLISQHRGSLGAFQNRLEHALSGLATTHEQLVGAGSRLRDADVAAEVVALTRHRVRANVNAALAAQANVHVRNAMRLLAF